MTFHTRRHRRPQPRSPSPPPSMPSDEARPSRPSFPSSRLTLPHQAIHILTTAWGPHAGAWKLAGCTLGRHPHGWPPRMLSALAGLARIAGPARRAQALRMVEVRVAREGRPAARPAPEDVRGVAEVLGRESVESDVQGRRPVVRDSVIAERTGKRGLEGGDARGDGGKRVKVERDAAASRAMIPGLLEETAGREDAVASLRREMAAKEIQLARERVEKRSMAAEVEERSMAAEVEELKRRLQVSDDTLAASRAEAEKLRIIPQQKSRDVSALNGEHVTKQQLDLELAEMALAARSADADCWRAHQGGYRYLLDDHKRLSRLALQASRKNKEIRDLRYRLRVAERMYTELDNGKWNVWKEEDDNVKVVKGDEGLEVFNAVLRRDNERLRMQLEKLTGRS